MEAVALYDFQATQRDELSFNRGDLLKVLDMKNDQNWYTAESHGEEGLVPKPYIELRPHEWWYGKTARAEAEQILRSEGTDGSFLVRESEANPGDFSVSVKFGDNVQHYKVLRDGEGKYFLWVMKFPSLNTLIEYHKTQSISKTQHIFLKEFKRKTGVPAGAPAAPRENPVIPVVMRNAAPAPTAVREAFCEALYDFKPQNSDELQLSVGQKIKIINRDDGNWWMGECNGQSGMFPATYVRELD